MMKIRILLAVLCMLCSLTAFADRGGMVYNDYKIQAKVQKDNVWDVTETITITYNEPRHGFYRYIPTKYSRFLPVKMADGKDSLMCFRYAMELTDITVNEEAVMEDDGDNRVIRIGSENLEITGTHTYEISYRLQYPDDRYTAKDFLFHSILGADFNAEIEHLSFDVAFEKPLPADALEQLKIYSGKYGNTDESVQVALEKSATHLVGTADSIAPNQAVTLYAEMPEGYYEGATKTPSLPCGIFFWLAVICAVVIIVMAQRMHAPSITKQIEFYPPEGISPAEVGTIIDNQVDVIDMAALIPWLAGKGYLKIQEESEGKFFKSETLRVTKLKELPDSLPEYQRKLIEALFGEEKEIVFNDLEPRPATMKAAFNGLGDVFKGEKNLMSWSGWSGLCYLLPIFAFCALWFSSSVEMFDGDYLLFAILFVAIPSALHFFLESWQSNRQELMSNGAKIFFKIAFAAMWAVACFLWIVCRDYGDYLQVAHIVLIYALLWMAIGYLKSFHINSEYRAKMMGKLLGLKEFIETADEPRLKTLLEDDPEYFYRIMPYAMVFGLTDKWADQFRNLKIEQPDWYNGTNFNSNFMAANMVHSLSSSVSDAITTVSHDPSSSTGAGGGGGGFSGGGGGGGGGGSW